MNAKPFAAAFLGLATALAVAKPNAQDAKFVASIAYGNRFESRGGKVAMARGTKPALKEYGAMLVSMHDGAQTKLVQIANATGVALPSGLAKGDAKLITKFESLSGRAFDRTYKRAVLDHHRYAMAGIQEEIRKGSDPQIVGYAREMLGVVKGHIRALEAVQV